MAFNPAATFLASIGAAYSAAFALSVVRGMMSRHWPRVPGEVLSAETLHASHRYPRSGFRQHVYDHFAFKYVAPDRHAKAGYERIGNVVRFGPVSRALMRRLIAEYPPGTAIEVAVNPRNNKQAVFLVGPSPRAIVGLITALGAFVLGVVWLLTS